MPLFLYFYNYKPTLTDILNRKTLNKLKTICYSSLVMEGILQSLPWCGANEYSFNSPFNKYITSPRFQNSIHSCFENDLLQ